MFKKNTVGWAVVLLALAAVVAAGPSAVGKGFKSNWPSKASCNLLPTAVEPHASGRANVTDVTFPPPDWWAPPYGTLAVTGRGLTPGETYSVTYCGYYGWNTYYSGDADKKGNLYPPVQSIDLAYVVPVIIANANGETVLEGTVVLHRDLPEPS